VLVDVCVHFQDVVEGGGFGSLAIETAANGAIALLALGFGLWVWAFWQ